MATGSEQPHSVKRRETRRVITSTEVQLEELQKLAQQERSELVSALAALKESIKALMQRKNEEAMAALQEAEALQAQICTRFPNVAAPTVSNRSAKKELTPKQAVTMISKHA